MAEWAISVVGVAGDTIDTLTKEAAAALAGARLVAGGRRLLDTFAPAGCATVVITDDLSPVLDALAEGRSRGPVCVLASGDPGFFGIVRPLAERFGPVALDVHPAPSSVSLAFARLGLNWDDAVVVSAHGRSLGAAARVAAIHPKVAVLVSPGSPPELLGRELLDLGVPSRRVSVCRGLGTGTEVVDHMDLPTLAAGRWDPLSVVILRDDDAVTPGKTLAWGLPDHAFDHRAGMVTKAEVRAVAMGKLALLSTGVLWDIGAGSGSVAVECARLLPHLRVIAVEPAAADAARIRANAQAHGARVEVVEGAAPAVLAELPDPDRVFVGGGGLEVLDAVVSRLSGGGRAVATFAALDRAAAAHALLGHLVEVGVSRGRVLPGGGVRLEAENPVFVAWGPGE